MLCQDKKLAKTLVFREFLDRSEADSVSVGSHLRDTTGAILSQFSF
jgi:hypothetical protein